MAETLTDFYNIILEGDTTKLISVFVAEPVIDTPFEGKISGRDAVIEFINQQKKWLSVHEARQQFMELTSSPERICVEIVLHLQRDNRNIDLPVAIVADIDRDKIFSVRVYHSTWPFTGKHEIREPLIKPANKLDEPQFVEQYMQALGKGDAETILGLFEDSGYAREPSGSDYKHSGKNGLREFYSTILQDGGILLNHCTVTFDGKNAVIEYIVESWGKTKLLPQAGVAVYELGKDGKIHAARIYDDVTPPGEK
ncbi:nuclear transport factor 2 family protein [Methanolobus sp. ZRKC2]|uniref:nuclear transport factor 2 family protein n=1 Tax=Methanolobus sp. ZRKC2 TaxID=3125783 RepID=UPI003244681E